jgi:hypothetical protein
LLPTYLPPSQFHGDLAGNARCKAFGVPISKAAWRTKPSWAVVATADRAINPTWNAS